MKSSKTAFKPMYIFDESTTSKVDQQLPSKPTTQTFNELLHRLYSKYDDCSSASNLKYTETIIKKAPKSQTILFKDFKDYDQKKQYMDCTYKRKDIDNKFQEVIGYYVFYQDIPRLFMMQLSFIVSKRIEQHRVLRYKALKNTLGITAEDLKESLKQIGDSNQSKCLPTGILEEQTQNSIRSIVKKLSVIILQQHQKQQKYALTQGCLTLMRTNKKKIDNFNKLKTIECVKSKQKDVVNVNKKSNKQNRKTQAFQQKPNIKKTRLFSASKDQKKTTRCASSKRKESNKSVEDYIKKHMRHLTKSPELVEKQKTLKKKHIRMLSSQPDQMYAVIKNSRKMIGKSSYQQIYLEGHTKTKQKPTFIKKKTRFQN